MSGSGSGRLRIDRILVALDASPSSLAALEAAVELAADYGAALIGLFVEDVNLVRMAQLPFSRKVVEYNARVRDLELEDLERQLRAQGERARLALAQRATARGVRWSFRVSRGEIPLEVLAEAEGVDFIILGKTGWSGRRRLGSTTRVVLSKAAGHVLVLERGVRISRPVNIVYDGSELGKEALAAGATLAERENLALTVILLADSDEGAAKLQDEAASWLRGRNLAARFHWLVPPDPDDLVKAVQAAGCLLVIPRQLRSLEGDPVPDLVDGLRCPVLVVR